MKNINPMILKALNKMVRGVKIELNSKGKERNKHCNDRWWHIQSISNDELTICSTTHFITNVSFDEVKL